MSDYKVTHWPNRSRFEICEDGHTAYVEYYVHDGCADILHTIVPVHMENRGIGSCLVKATYDWARAEGLNPLGTCSFAAAWLRRHPDYLE